jgi:hypothetical protein
MFRSVRDFGAAGDGVTDDTEAIQHAVGEGAGQLFFPPGDYLVTQPILLGLPETGRAAVTGTGGTAKIIAGGPGPAFHLRGSHGGTAGPGTFEERIWARERMPTFFQLEIEGRHPEADGILVEGTMQSVFDGLLLRKLRHGIHLRDRARNVIIANCHIYDNTGVGIFLDEVNLHQINISNSHISYNHLSGIKVLNGEVRNIQITGNDIEYNYDQDAGAEAAPSAEIWFETTADGATIREGTIASNTIQSRQAPGGSNICFLGHADTPDMLGMIAVSGNLIGSQEVNVRLTGCRAVTLTGNVLYSGHDRNLLVRHSRNIIAAANSFDHNPGYLPRELATGVSFDHCTDCSFSGSTIQDAFAGEHTVSTPVSLTREGMLELRHCKRFTISGTQIIDAAPCALFVDSSSHVQVSGCTMLDSREEPKMPCAVRWTGPGAGNHLIANTFGAGTERVLDIDEESGVVARENLSA